MQINVEVSRRTSSGDPQNPWEPAYAGGPCEALGVPATARRRILRIARTPQSAGICASIPIDLRGAIPNVLHSNSAAQAAPRPATPAAHRRFSATKIAVPGKISPRSFDH